MSLDDNSTDALIGDIEALRQSLNIDKFVLFGGSWSTFSWLMIAFPEHVSRLILRGIFLGTRREVDWFCMIWHGFFLKPMRFTSFLDPEERGDLLTSYFNRLINSNPRIHQKAAEAWTSCMRLLFYIARRKSPYGRS